jgi:hypothetical protein
MVVGAATITGSANLYSKLNVGLGIVGGTNHDLIDGAEWMQFSFGDSVHTVSYFVQYADPAGGGASVEAFDVNDVSLGVQDTSGAGLHNVSLMFENVPISRFVVTADGGGHRISQLTFAPWCS